ncbi:hypothetical protein AeNC1_015449, partial [Aphanomyces euteiches]
MSSGVPPASAWDPNSLAARYDRYRVDLAKISEAPSEEFDLRIAGDAPRSDTRKPKSPRRGAHAQGVVPVAPRLGETALEYAAVWFLKLANDPNQVHNKLCDYTHVLEDLANYAKTRHRGPRLHFYVVRWLLAVRSHRYSELVSRYGPEIFGPWHRAPAGLHERSRSRSQSPRDRSRSQSSHRRSSSRASRRSRSRAQSHHRGHSASPEDAWSDEEKPLPRPTVADLPRRRHDFDGHWMTDSQYEVAVLQVSVKKLQSVVDAMSTRVEKLLELGPMVEHLLRRTDRLPQFVDAGLDRLSQEDRQARGMAVPSAAPALAALPPNPE